jgi:hypothetical protein
MPSRKELKSMSRQEFVVNLRKVLAYDQAMAKLQEAGLDEEFVRAIEKDPELLQAINKIAPNLSGAASAGFITVHKRFNTFCSPRRGECVSNQTIQGVQSFTQQKPGLQRDHG